ncbi:MAG: hypothetical protein J1E43_03815 [Christensenellaceae bacterium]|nr:hypothetical protein [Christensenellaceae bacterium]
MKSTLNKLLISFVCVVMLFAVLGAVALASGDTCTHEYAKVERPNGTYPATCKEPGGYIVRVTCENCGAFVNEYKQPDSDKYPVDSKAHSFKDVPVQGECAGAGTITQKVCVLCGYSETNTSDGNHKWETVSVKATTCGETDYTYEQCAQCGMTRNYKYGSSLFTHTFTKNKTEVVREATCSVPGESKQVCDCGQETRVLPIATTAHSYAAAVTVQGDCKTKTRTSETCTVCRYEHILSYGSYVHSFVETNTATCTEDGIRKSACTICGTVNWSQPSAKLGHTAAYWKSDADRHWRECSRCGEEMSSGSHTGNNTNDYCTNRISCKVCGYLMSSGGKHPGYTAVDSGSDATHNMKCTKCSYVQSTAQHTYTALDGDCTKGKICTACGHRASGNAQHALSSTWTSAGTEQHGRKCTNAGCTYMQMEDHEWSDWEVVKEPTTTSVGTEAKKCVKCRTTTVRSIPQLKPGQTAAPTKAPEATNVPATDAPSNSDSTVTNAPATDAASETAAPTAKADDATATPKPATSTTATSAPKATNASATATPKPANNATATSAPKATNAAATATPKPANNATTTTAPKATNAAATATPKPTSSAAAVTNAPTTASNASAAPTQTAASAEIPTAAPVSDNAVSATTAPTDAAEAPAAETENAATAEPEAAPAEELPEETADDPVRVAAPLTKDTDCADAGVPCTEEMFMQGGMLIRVCTICGNVRVDFLFDGVGDEQPVFAEVPNVVVTGAAQEGQLVLRAASLAGSEEAFVALSAAWEMNGKAQSLVGAVQVSLPLVIAEAADDSALSVPTADFRLVRVDVHEDGDGVRTEAWTEVDYSYEDGVLTFEMEQTAIYLLISA